MKKLLLVDDQPHIIRLLRLSLSRNGYETDIAFNGEEALAKLKKVCYDVLITDIEMPHMNGRQLCDALRRDLPDCRPYIFIITARTERDLREWALALGNACFLEKPVSLKELVAKLAAHFEGVEQNEQAPT